MSFCKNFFFLRVFRLIATNVISDSTSGSKQILQNILVSLTSMRIYTKCNDIYYVNKKTTIPWESNLTFVLLSPCFANRVNMSKVLEQA